MTWTSLGTFKLRGPWNEGMKLYMVMMGMKLPSFPTFRASQFKDYSLTFLFVQITFFFGNFSLCSGKKYNL